MQRMGMGVLWAVCHIPALLECGNRVRKDFHYRDPLQPTSPPLPPTSTSIDDGNGKNTIVMGYYESYDPVRVRNPMRTRSYSTQCATPQQCWDAASALEALLVGVVAVYGLEK
ncbi:hypothetical protein BS47DRAFT_1369636 [Hydnum rufescens UP504]|uniref:Uncharacterized protein n=1 Tax=Hydnum rufescens UP504 TaxID=1448309 RepID=A0A9P6AE63_9AGAM|nr:hypothetical protein BS47DRAFT_1369636 [Hydnum rufescens UP504]